MRRHTMQNLRYSILALFASFFLFTSAFAIGSGSGGSAPGCAENIWNCTDWSSCSPSGVKTRNCVLTFSCPTAHNEKPPTSQSCVPPPQSVTTPGTSSRAACVASKWECSSWSSSCDIYGQEHRSCHLIADCPASPTPSPPTSQACSHLQCGNQSTLHDRIACRLNLAPEGALQELKIQYLPEECRSATANTEKKECVLRYKSYAPCWNLPAGEERFSCAQKVLNIESSIADETKQCKQKTGADRASCEKTLKEKILYMVKFRFYDLEQRAEELARRGADVNAVADLETIIETKKGEFNEAKTKAELEQIILDVRSAWKDFVHKVENQVK